jgi:hypothetical protein
MGPKCKRCNLFQLCFEFLGAHQLGSFGVHKTEIPFSYTEHCYIGIRANAKIAQFGMLDRKGKVPGMSQITS